MFRAPGRGVPLERKKFGTVLNIMVTAPGYPPSLAPYLYRWPTDDLTAARGWRASATQGFIERAMPEPEETLEQDSRWPAIFPSAICLVTTGAGESCAIEKVVGPCIV